MDARRSDSDFCLYERDKYVRWVDLCLCIVFQDCNRSNGLARVHPDTINCLPASDNIIESG